MFYIFNADDVTYLTCIHSYWYITLNCALSRKLCISLLVVAFLSGGHVLSGVALRIGDMVTMDT